MRERKDIEKEIGTNSYGKPNDIGTAVHLLLEVTLDNRDLLNEIKKMITEHGDEMRVAGEKILKHHENQT